MIVDKQHTQGSIHFLGCNCSGTCFALTISNATFKSLSWNQRQPFIPSEAWCTVISLPGCYDKRNLYSSIMTTTLFLENISIYFILLITFLFITIIAMLIYKWIYLLFFSLYIYLYLDTYIYTYI